MPIPVASATLSIISLDQRNASDRAHSVLAIPFGSAGYEGPTVMQMEPGETGLPESVLEAHFISVIEDGY